MLPQDSILKGVFRLETEGFHVPEREIYKRQEAVSGNGIPSLNNSRKNLVIKTNLELTMDGVVLVVSTEMTVTRFRQR